MEKSDQYRKFARECLAMAQTATDEQTRAALVQMAQVWFRLVEDEVKEPNEVPR